MKLRPLALLLTWLCGCATPLPGGRFTQAGFENRGLPFTISYADPARGLLLDEDWQVESHRLEHGKLSGPKGAEHSAKESVGLDFDGDGTPDKSVSVAGHDLVLSRKSKNGQIMVFTKLLDAESANKHLSVLARELIERVAGLRLHVQRTQEGVTATATNFVTRMHDQLPVRVAGRDAYAVLVDVLTGEGDDDPMRMALVLLPAAAPVTMRSNLGEHAFPAVHLLTLMSDKRDFDDGMVAFQRLLGAVRLEAAH